MIGDDLLFFLRKRSDQMLWQVSWLVFRTRSLPVAGQWHEESGTCWQTYSCGDSFRC